jgi:hypothetical protein
VSVKLPKTISEVADELERIQQELFCLLKVVEKMEEVDTTGPVIREKKLASRHGRR